MCKREMKEDAPDMVNNSSTDLELEFLSKTRLTWGGRAEQGELNIHDK